ncbi:hypothetical protein ABZ354_03955 [Streptomyces sp. NPDC005925]|uniref:hypothetical protein n=1 Tax=Streptomyces sp. NPDC005925 TaxID=3157172 RepID=UPI00340AEAC2
MSTGLIIALVIVAVVVLAAVLTLRARRGPDLRRRFGSEYERAVARHDGDTKAAERELAERVQRHGHLRERPLEPAERERYEARWAAAQERFVDSPREAAAEADRLLADLAGARGYPNGGQYEEQVAALSVHHAAHVDGYRRVHRAARAHGNGTLGGNTRDGAGWESVPGKDPETGLDTEEMREAMVEARALFDALVSASPADHHRHRAEAEGGRHTRAHTRAHTRGQGHRPLSSALHGRRTKEG